MGLLTGHVLVLLALPFYLYFFDTPLSVWILAIVLYFLGMIALTTGYHRYFAHRAFKTNKVIEFLLIFFASLTLNSSVAYWASEHRNHHAYTDTDKDPYNIKRGFWYAHCLWLLNGIHPVDWKIIPDIKSNKLLMFQHRYITLWMLLTNFIMVLPLGYFLGDLWAVIFVAGLLRIVVTQHCIFFINSLAHIWGSKSYTREMTAVDNFILALLTGGEGYHNYHHTFPSDYRNGIKWYHFDPTKWLIWILSKFGITKNLVKAQKPVIQKRLIKEDMNILREKLENIRSDLGKGLSEKSQELYDKIITELDKIREGLIEDSANLKRYYKDWHKLFKLAMEL